MCEYMGLFRGKWTKTGEWVQGYYVRLHDAHKKRETYRLYTGTAESEAEGQGEYAFYADYYDVVPDTIGGCTGQTDKRNKMIEEAANTSRNLYMGVLDSGRATDMDFAALAYFHQQEQMYRCMIPGVINALVEELGREGDFDA